jgi:uncharacterized protein YecE (DUF72 family)
MRFGKVEDISAIDFGLPNDAPLTNRILSNTLNPNYSVYIGCGHWGKDYLHNFYPIGTKDELAFYSTQFNSIELNASFYKNYKPEHYRKWYDRTEKIFKFFPKIYQGISHFRRLNNVEDYLNNFLLSVTALEDKLGTIFLQLREDFSTSKFDLLQTFIKNWPIDLPLAIELRNSTWYTDEDNHKRIFDLCEKRNVNIIITDSAGRRDLLHMRLSNLKPFIRLIGANHKSDYERIDEWAKRISKWIDKGISEITFFVHQNEEMESPQLANYFSQQLSYYQTQIK